MHTHVTTIIIQSEKIISRKFTLLEVDEDNIRLSVFVKSKLGCNSFENGRAFYEFNQEEDLLYYKEVVLLPTNKDNIKNVYVCVIIIPPEVTVI